MRHAPCTHPVKGVGLSLIERDVVVGHGEDADVNGGGIDGGETSGLLVVFGGFGPVGDVALGDGKGNERVTHVGVPFGPCVAADHVLGGGGVEGAIGVVFSMIAFGDGVDEVLGACFDHVVVVEPADLEGVNGGGGAGEPGAAAGLVAKAAGTLVVAVLDELDGLLDGIVRNENAGVFRSAQGNDL